MVTISKHQLKQLLLLFLVIVGFRKNPQQMSVVSSVYGRLHQHFKLKKIIVSTYQADRLLGFQASF